MDNLGAYVTIGLVLIAIFGSVVYFLWIRPARSTIKGPIQPSQPWPEPPAARRDGSNEDADAEREDEPAESNGDDERADDPEEESSGDDTPWREELKGGDEHMAEFAYDDAIAAYESALEGARDEIGRDSIEVAEILIKLGRAYQARDDGSDDEDYFSSYYQRALAILEQKRGPLDASLLPVLALLIAANDQSGLHSEADVLIRRFEAIESGQPVPFGQHTAARDTAVTVLLSSARGLREQNNIDGAVSGLDAAIDEANEKCGSDSVEMAEILVELGEVVQARDDESNDEETTPFDYLRALSIYEQRLGPFNAQLVPVLRDLISFYDQVGEHGKAEGLITRLQTVERLSARRSAEPKASES